ncbi:Structural constituent of ribosome [Mactra antiquata]
MAGSRSHKVSTIFHRVQGLLTAEGLEWKDRPLWYDVMEKFPPKTPPKFNRPLPPDTVKTIVYPEDLIRAKYFERFVKSDFTKLKSHIGWKTLPQMFIEEYVKHQREGATVDEIFDEVEAKLNQDRTRYKRYIHKPNRSTPRQGTVTETETEST